MIYKVTDWQEIVNGKMVDTSLVYIRCVLKENVVWREVDQKFIFPIHLHSWEGYKELPPLPLSLNRRRKMYRRQYAFERKGCFYFIE